MIRRVALCQFPCDSELDSDRVGRIEALRPDLVCLPEYFFMHEHRTHQAEARYREENIALIRELSERLRCAVIGGSLVEERDGRYYNVSYLADRGGVVGSYVKNHLFHAEEKAGMTAGTECNTFHVGNAVIGILICADVLQPSVWKHLAKFHCDIVFVPTTSPKKAETTEEKYRRDEEIFVNGAKVSGSYVAKCCAVGTIFGNPLQGRSLIASPDGILVRATPNQEAEELILCADLDLATVSQWREES